MLDSVKNFSVVTLKQGITSGQTTVELVSGHGDRLPNPGVGGDTEFNLVIFNSSDYPGGAKVSSEGLTIDPYIEIIRCTAKSGDTLTIARAQEGTTAKAHNIYGKVYQMQLSITKKMINDIDLELYKRSKDLYMQGKILYGSDAHGDLLFKSNPNSDGKIKFGDTDYFDETNQTWVLNNLHSTLGRWISKGIVVSPTIETGETALGEPNVIYEGNAQILSGTVFKMWYGAGVTGKVYYAESLDGVTWAKRSTPVITGYQRPFVFKNGDTYYLYGSTSSQIDCWSSSDGITWSLFAFAVVSTGGEGAWDHQVIANCCVWVEGSTWYMLYDACPNTYFIYKIGLATSDDGIIWTKSGSNPIVTGTIAGGMGGPWVKKIGSVYWLWGHGGIHAPTPTDIYRFHSTDLINWTQDPSDRTVFARTNTEEGKGVPNGQVADPVFIELNGRTYVWYAVTNDQINFNISLAIADFTLTDLVETDEGRQQSLSSSAIATFDGLKIQGPAYIQSSLGIGTDLNVYGHLIVSSYFQVIGGLYPPNANTGGAGLCGLWAGSGAPNDAYGNNGDVYIRNDGAEGTYIYVKTAGSWSGIL